VTDVDPLWVSCWKAAPLILLTAPWLMIRAGRGQSIGVPRSELGFLVAVSLFSQVAGNGAFQWALGLIGIALTVPITLGTMIVGGALLGRFMLGEAITTRTAISTGILIVAIGVLYAGAGEARQTLAETPAAAATEKVAETIAANAADKFWKQVAGVACACLAGLAYASLSVAVRRSLQAGAPLPMVLMIVGVMGVVVLGAWSLLSQGAAALLETTLRDAAVMFAAGVLNALSFLTLSKALRLTTVAHVNAVNASQAAMAAAAGIVLFHEPLTAALAAGVGLTIAGLLIFRPERPKPLAEV